MMIVQPPFQGHPRPASKTHRRKKLWRAAYAVGPLLVRHSSRPSKSRQGLDFQSPADLAHAPRWQNRGKPLPLSRIGLPFSEKQIPQVVETLESGGNQKKFWRGSICAQGRRAILPTYISRSQGFRTAPPGFAGFPRTVGRVESLGLAFHAFHGPAFPQLPGPLRRFSSFLLSVHRPTESVRFRAGFQDVGSICNAIQQRFV
jgi:hypothetical protein